MHNSNYLMKILLFKSSPQICDTQTFWHYEFISALGEGGGINIATLWWYRATQTLTTVPHINLTERD